MKEPIEKYQIEKYQIFLEHWESLVGFAAAVVLSLLLNRYLCGKFFVKYRDIEEYRYHRRRRG